MTCESREGLDWPAHPCSLISLQGPKICYRNNKAQPKEGRMRNNHKGNAIYETTDPRTKTNCNRRTALEQAVKNVRSRGWSGGRTLLVPNFRWLVCFFFFFFFFFCFFFVLFVILFLFFFCFFFFFWGGGCFFLFVFFLLFFFFFFFKLSLEKKFTCKVERLNVKQRRSRWDGSLWAVSSGSMLFAKTYYYRMWQWNNWRIPCALSQPSAVFPLISVWFPENRK